MVVVEGGISYTPYKRGGIVCEGGMSGAIYPGEMSGPHSCSLA